MNQTPLKITFLGPAHPYRGGLAAIMHTMASLYQRQGHEVDLKTFTVQYPSFLFPGKSQYTEGEPPQGIKIERCLNTTNPLNWLRLGRRIRREAPDVVILKYWTPFMAPAFGTVARLARRNGKTRFICQIDNVEPHEPHFFDRWFNRWFLGSIDGFVYMSEQVGGELRHYTSAPALFSPHPMFENYGEPIARKAALKALELDPSKRYALFFGLIRDYKGLDWLLEAWRQLIQEGRLPEDYMLLVAGEFYADRRPYEALLADPILSKRVILHDRFIPDEEVKNYFSASDFSVLPYKTATQSGVTQIAYKFTLPTIVTDVGGLKEILPHNRAGLVAEPTIEGIAAAIEQLARPEEQLRLKAGMAEESKRFTWEAMCEKMLEVFRLTKG